MPVKIKGTRALTVRLFKILPDARTLAAREFKRVVVDAIVDQVKSGNSPVAGKGSYKKYATSTQKKKGRAKPVDLTDSGDMLKSLKARQTKDNRVILEFIGKRNNDIAGYHQFGVKERNLPERSILPVKARQTFKAKILRKIIAAARKAIRIAARKVRG